MSLRELAISPPISLIISPFTPNASGVKLLSDLPIYFVGVYASASIVSAPSPALIILQHHYRQLHLHFHQLLGGSIICYCNVQDGIFTSISSSVLSTQTTFPRNLTCWLVSKYHSVFLRKLSVRLKMFV